MLCCVSVICLISSSLTSTSAQFSSYSVPDNYCPAGTYCLEKVNLKKTRAPLRFFWRFFSFTEAYMDQKPLWTASWGFGDLTKFCRQLMLGDESLVFRVESAVLWSSEDLTKNHDFFTF